MRWPSIFTALGLVALAAAQSSASAETNRSSAASAASTASATASLSPEVVCLQKCGSMNLCCQAACVGVPCPNQGQVNATTDCAAQCPQGNGTASETENYAKCQASCVSSYFLSSGSATAAPSATSSGASFSFGGSSATATGAESSGSGAATNAAGSKTASASATKTGSSGNGADNLQVGTVGLGFLGLVIAGLAL